MSSTVICFRLVPPYLSPQLQTTYPIAARYHQEIQETCRVFPMTLRVVGFSRVPPPLALPAPPPSDRSCSPESSSKSKGKGKEKAKDPELDPPSSSTSTYDPLIYALPVIHVVGEFRGSDVDESVARRARGTVRMVGDRAIRWNLVSLSSTSSHMHPISQIIDVRTRRSPAKYLLQTETSGSWKVSRLAGLDRRWV